MSRRRSHSRLTQQPARWVTHTDTTAYDDGATAHTLNDQPAVPWWYANRMPEPWASYHWHEWASAWAHITLRVASSVWSRQGARMYDIHRDKELRDDLRDWLIVEAVKSAADFTPNPWHPAPEAAWGAFLRGCLTERARQHFSQVVGRNDKGKGQAAIAAYNRRIASTDELDDIEAADGIRVTRHPLHGESFLLGKDPASIVIRLEDFARSVDQIEREDRRAGRWSTSSTTTGDICLTVGCDRPSIARGLCRRHYNQQRRQSGATCTTDGCTNNVEARGLCTTHYQAARDAAVKDGTWERYGTKQTHCSIEGCDGEHHGLGLCQRHYQAQKKPNQSQCQEFDCYQPVHSHGRCRNHHRAQLRDQAPPCAAEGCALPGAYYRGMCSTHYRKWLKERNAS